MTHYETILSEWKRAGSKRHSIAEMGDKLRDIDDMKNYPEIALNISILVLEYFKQNCKNLDVKMRKPAAFSHAVKYRPSAVAYALNYAYLHKHHPELFNVLCFYLGL